jgi:hypothetical protein
MPVNKSEKQPPAPRLLELGQGQTTIFGQLVEYPGLSRGDTQFNSVIDVMNSGIPQDLDAAIGKQLLDMFLAEIDRCKLTIRTHDDVSAADNLSIIVNAEFPLLTGQLSFRLNDKVSLVVTYRNCRLRDPVKYELAAK